MTRSTLPLIVLFLSTIFQVTAQECVSYLPPQKGAELTFKEYNSKDKLQASNKQTVIDKRVDNGNLELDVKQEHFDKKGKPTIESTFTVKCEEGIFKIDMRALMNNQMAASMQNMEVTVDASEFELPSKLEVGQSLKDANIDISVSAAGFSMGSLSTKITNRNGVKKETITTEAGTFECYKMTHDFSGKILFANITGTTVQWYAPEIGLIRQENYNSKGELTSYSVLSAIKK